MVEALMREAMLLLLMWLIGNTYQNWRLIRTVQKAQQRRPKAKKRKKKGVKEFQGVTRKPVCASCEGAEVLPASLPIAPPLISPKRAQRRSVDTALQYCPEEECRYYGWIGRGNISSNGHPFDKPFVRLRKFSGQAQWRGASAITLLCLQGLF